jgi:dTDP-4-amino-4,6-dideoxygalactose transaminase
MIVADEHVKHHQWIHEQYVQRLGDIDGLVVHCAPEAYMQSNYWLSTIRFEDGKHTINGGLLPFAEKLSEANIETRPLWKPMHMQPVYKDAPSYTNGVSERLFMSGLCLPSGPCVGEAELNYIIQTMKENL